MERMSQRRGRRGQMVFWKMRDPRAGDLGEVACLSRGQRGQTKGGGRGEVSNTWRVLGRSSWIVWQTQVPVREPPGRRPLGSLGRGARVVRLRWGRSAYRSKRWLLREAVVQRGETSPCRRNCGNSTVIQPLHPLDSTGLFHRRLEGCQTVQLWPAPSP